MRESVVRLRLARGALAGGEARARACVCALKFRLVGVVSLAVPSIL